jgi:hypothetical protein
MARRRDFRCPECRKKLFDGETPPAADMRMKCTRSGCGFIGVPVADGAQPWHRTYCCTTCKRQQNVERPVDAKTLCMVCGTHTLVITAETGSRTSAPAGNQVPDHVSVGRR